MNTRANSRAVRRSPLLTATWLSSASPSSTTRSCPLALSSLVRAGCRALPLWLRSLVLSSHAARGMLAVAACRLQIASMCVRELHVALWLTHWCLRLVRAASQLHTGSRSVHTLTGAVCRQQIALTLSRARDATPRRRGFARSCLGPRACSQPAARLQPQVAGSRSLSCP